MTFDLTLFERKKKMQKNTNVKKDMLFILGSSAELPRDAVQEAAR